MPKRIFDHDSDSDCDVGIKTDNEYAKNYDNWRKKEELNKLKTKYGEESLQLLDEETSSSSDDDEEGEQLTEEVEKQFFKTLSCLKNKDPRIYDENVQFFNEVEDSSKKKKKKEKPMYITDYERELVLKTNGEFSESEHEDDSRARSPTYIEEQKKIKESFKNVLSKIDDEDDDEWGGMLKIRQKTEEEKRKEEAEYKEWLAGQKEELDDKNIETELKPLKEYWNSPNLDDGEKFLRDYILKKKFLSKEDDEYIPTYEEIIHDSDQDLSEDEATINQQEEFEHKYNFRFEEPDQEFIKRYPRTMEHSLRKTDDRRKLKRAETKERKQQEKQQKMQELKKLQELKRKEIEEKIQKLKEITGNDNIEIKEEDLDGDFDPEAHDKRMQSIFNDEFYEGPEDDQKPEFPDIDEYLDLENWEKWNGVETEESNNEEQEEYVPHCEDEDFNMDCDYDPKAAVKNELLENTKGKKKRKRKSLFAKAVSQPKPVFDPKDKTYEEYLDEYYKFDCEDIIGDIPCRFKYRKVVPNSFGLTIEEILKANDRELNRWCSLKKAMQHRPDHVEKYDQIAYAKKSQNLSLKRKILPSLFENNEDNKSDVKNESEGKKSNKKGKKRSNVNIEKEQHDEEMRNGNTEQDTPIQQSETEKTLTAKKKKKKKGSLQLSPDKIPELTNDTEQNNKINKKKKEALESNVTVDDKLEEANKVESEVNKQKHKKKKKKKMASEKTTALNNNDGKFVKKRKRSVERSDNDEVVPKKKVKKNKNLQKSNQKIGISDARLSAYGINPKKYKNKLKYGKKK